ncbi:unnamed protein product [Cyprideis torosa]|uniref:Uncharacterized protein n=1 Tax=Cyprideis torosa TaxID=163714 RepID=A0A7R8W923_9CRUS|nr:unnamed protein product [Cyprideis torosa]CAG0886871.1 unnamed protein product [Cyprideis torosa]
MYLLVLLMLMPSCWCLEWMNVPNSNVSFSLSFTDDTYAQAETKCKEAGAELAYIESKEESEFVIDMLESWQLGRVWIAGFDSNVSFTSYAQSRRRRPLEGVQKKCGIFQNTLAWYQGNCKEERPFICEKLKGYNPHQSYWIGLMQTAKGEYVWTNTSMTSEEIETQMSDSQCVMVQPKLKWGFTSCDEKRRSLCEVEHKPHHRSFVYDNSSQSYLLTIQEPQAFEAAKETCREIQGNLVTVKGAERDELLTTDRNLPRHLWASEPWIGLLDLDGEGGNLSWVDGTPVKYRNLIDDTCLQLRSFSRWRKDSCDVPSKFICKRQQALPLCPPETCGYQPGENLWPWLVALVDDDNVLCAGVIVSTRHILTVGNCVERYKENPASLKVRTKNQETKFKFHDVEKIFIHPDQDNGTVLSEILFQMPEFVASQKNADHLINEGYRYWYYGNAPCAQEVESLTINVAEQIIERQRPSEKTRRPPKETRQIRDHAEITHLINTYANATRDVVEFCRGISYNFTMNRPELEKDDFILITEFSEIEGPVPLLIIPQDARLDLDLNDLAVKVMSTDYQGSGSSHSCIIEDVQVLHSNLSPGLHAYTHYITLCDVKARGFVRPICLSYLSHEKDKIRLIFEELRERFLKASSVLKQGNRLWFGGDLEEMLKDLTHTKETYLHWQTGQLVDSAPQIS